MNKIYRTFESIVFENEYGKLFNDNIQVKGKKGHYLRWQWSTNGVVVIPVFNKTIALKKMYRYPPDIYSLEFPRGEIRSSETIVDAGNRELMEEYKLLAKKSKIIGKVYAETGLIQNFLTVVMIEIETTKIHESNSSVKEDFEIIDNQINWYTIELLNNSIKNGKIQCGITLACIALYQSQNS